jgi:predicted transcriptional regulator
VQSNGDCRSEGPSFGTLVELLNDEFARNIVALIRTDRKTVDELVTMCEMSRPTIYRRLERLEQAGLVETGTRFGEDGYHRKTFRATVGRVDIDLSEDGFTADVTPCSSGPGSASGPGSTERETTLDREEPSRNVAQGFSP